MTRLAYIPTDECPSVFDDMAQAEEVLTDEGVPTWLATILADAASRQWTDEAAIVRDLYRHVQPFFETAQREMSALHRNRRRA